MFFRSQTDYLLIIFFTQLTLSCSVGQFELGGVCQSCLLGCKVCPSADVCSICYDGKYKNNLNGVDYCENCPSYSRIKEDQYLEKFIKSSLVHKIEILFNINIIIYSIAKILDQYNSTICTMCQNHYYLDGQSCLECPSSCGLCMSMTTCFTCTVGYLSNNQCLPCTPPCITCIQASTQCTSCIDGFFMNGSGDCQQCNQPCFKCQNNADFCTNCQTPYQLSSSILNTCECQPGYYKDSNQVCQHCLASCKTCQQFATYCQSCIDSNQILQNSNTCVCKPGWMFHVNNINCVQCQLLQRLICLIQIIYKKRYQQYHVKSVFKRQINVFLVMMQSINKVKIVLANLDGYMIKILNVFNVRNLAKLVQQLLLILINLNYTHQCVTCEDPNHYINDSQNCVCKPGYFSDTLSTCVKCQAPCNECNAVHCITCIDSNKVTDTNFLCVCKDNYYMNGIDCHQCQQPCYNCIDSSDKCLTCIDTNKYVINYQCQCKPEFNKVEDFCCHQSCEKCLGMDNCIKCIKGYYLNGNITCLQCIKNCELCSNQISCEICKNGYFVDIDGQCINCKTNCNNCTNQEDCTQCKDGYYIEENQCYQCNENCKTCIKSAQVCQSCRLNYEINTFNNICQCLNGYYEFNNQCNQCIYPCKKCLNQEECIECIIIQNLFLNKQNKCQCNLGYYFYQKYCLSCDSICLTCVDNSLNCLTCDHDKFRILIGNSCLCNRIKEKKLSLFKIIWLII